MRSMVEIVARALCMAKMNAGPDAYPPGFRERRADTHWTQFADDARAAIAAMREPTAAQFAIANALEAKFKQDLKNFDVTGFCALIYQAMIDEVLK